jgi:mannose-6-phosphate isomerase-like protein (cupin superfamily)
MKVTRFSDAVHYVAPKHYDMRSMRLQGFESGGPENFWTGLSYFLPGGGAEMDESPLEKVYVVMDGKLTITTANGEVELGYMDSCCIPGGENRSVKNMGNSIASMLVIMPYPPKATS